MKKNPPVTATVTGTAIAEPCDCTFTDSKRLKVVCDQPSTPCEIFFCIDCTGSMGGVGDHRAPASIEQFLEDFADQGVIFRLGGVKFNDPNEYQQPPPDDSIDMDQLVSLNTFTNVGSFISGWVNNGYSPWGGWDPELQLDALHLAAQDMNA